MIITIDIALWGLVVGVVLPIIVGLVTARFAPSWVKSVTLMALSALVSIGQEILVAGQFEVKQTILKFALLFLTSVGLHYGFLKPSGVTGQNGVVQRNADGGLTSSHGPL